MSNSRLAVQGMLSESGRQRRPVRPRQSTRAVPLAGVMLALTLGAGVLLATTAAAQNTGQDAAQPWYKVEVLIFQHDTPATTHKEQEAWPAYPQLAYPPLLRALFDPARADAALAEVPGAISHVDALGRQTLYSRPWFDASTLQLQPWQFHSESAVFDHSNPVDALRQTRLALREALASIAFSPKDLDSPAPAVSVATESGVQQAVDALETELADNGSSVDEAPPLVYPPAFTVLPQSALEFRTAAARMRSREGWQLYWHRAWLQPMSSEERSIPLVVDDSGDRNPPDWPQLQGSLRLYLSRYLHLQASLWLNTDGSYLEHAQGRWRIDPPPRAPATLRLDHLNGQRLALWPVAELRPQAPQPEQSLRSAAESPSPALSTSGESGNAPTFSADSNPEQEWPWRHAILLEQNRRMRGDEVHYIDHPVLGMLIRLSPLSEQDLRKWQEQLQSAAWHQRHHRNLLLPLQPEQLALPPALQQLQLIVD